MVDTIMSVLSQILIFVFSMILYVCLAAKFLPLFLLKPKYNVSDIKDRGLKRYTFEGGRAITYAPSFNANKYIYQYILSSNNGEKYIKCKIDKSIFSIKYDVVVFNSCDKVIDTIQISDPINTAGITKAVMLPEDTSYVSVIVKEINKNHLPDSPKMNYSVVRVGLFAGFTVILTVIETLILKSSIVHVAKTLLSYTPVIGEQPPIGAILFATVIGLALSAIIFISHLTRDTGISK